MAAGIKKVANVKKKVEEILESICNSREERKKFLKNPDKDFTRNRKLSFLELVKFRLLRDHDTNNNDIVTRFGIGKKRPSTWAYLKGLNKIKSCLWDTLFRRITDSLSAEVGLSSFMEEYLLLGCDGTDIPIYNRPEDHRFHHTKKTDVKQVSFVHLNAIFSLLDNVCLDYLIQPYREKQEVDSLITMLKRVPKRLRKKVIVVVDRGYEAYNLIAWCRKLGIHFVIRIKDDSSNAGMARGLFRDYSEGRNDFTVKLKMTRSKCWMTRDDKSYKILSGGVAYDFLDQTSEQNSGCFYWDESQIKSHEISFRLVKFNIGKTDEVLVTDLDAKEFPPAVMKDVYHRRWREENSFRHLKFDADAINTHATTAERASEEIILALLMMNITSFMCIIAQAVLDKKNRDREKKLKYRYNISFSSAINACRIAFTSRTREGPKALLDELQRSRSPVRPNRSFARNVRPQGFRYFMYR